jgi:A/G-specific adenine glycosylase
MDIILPIQKINLNKNIQTLIDWSSSSFFSLPWRKHRTLYTTLVSEVMLQQTTVATVTKKFTDFLIKFPSWRSLAQAEQSEVMIEWRGLGYYQRARRLHHVAQLALDEDHFKNLLLTHAKMPGIGDYTTSALLAIGLNEPALAIDANIRRVLSRFLGQAPSDLKIKQFYEEHLTHFEPRALNEALMDLGRTFCTAKKALCSSCPLEPSCHTKGASLIEAAGVPSIKKDIALARILCVKANQILGYRKPKGFWLEGYLELPTFIIDHFNFHQYPGIELASLPNKPLFSFKSTITHHRITNHVYLVEDFEFTEEMDFYPQTAMWANTSMKMIQQGMLMLQQKTELIL